MRKPLPFALSNFFFLHANTHFIRSPASILCRVRLRLLWEWSVNDNVTEYAAFALISSKRAKEEKKKTTCANSGVELGHKIFAADECATKQTRTETRDRSHWTWTPKRICNHKVADSLLRPVWGPSGSRCEHILFCVSTVCQAQKALSSKMKKKQKQVNTKAIH